MIRQFELVEMVRAYNAGTNEDLLNRAYVFGVTAHGEQKRANGEPYFNHPIEVAAILTELRLDDATIVTALLHDTIEDTKVTYADIEQNFGSEIAQLVDGVTKLSKLALASRERAQAANFLKLLMAIARDPRVLLVKMADRLHNMRTINHLPAEKRERIARETVEIFAPLAGRMGMQRIRDELEDLAFAVLSPEARLSVMRRFVHLKHTHSVGATEEIAQMLQQKLAEEGLKAKVLGREKRPYAIWRKMQEKGVSFEQLSDIVGFRVIVDAEADCYRALGIIHGAFRAVPGRFKDYISGPKANGYRSIHTAVIGPSGARIEVQIRTQQMNEVAETGVAAHWSYKEGVRSENPFAVDPFRWLRDLVERVESGAPAGENPEDVLEDAKRELTFDQVFCFTPKGDVISLPSGATALDFAYAIHTDVGHTAVGVKINGRRAPLSTVLRNGQTVEVLQSQGQRPSPVWGEIAKTGRARVAIRRTIRAQEREEAARLGEKLLKRTFERAGAKWSQKAVETAAHRLGAGDQENLLADIGEAKLTAQKALGAVYPELAGKLSAEPDASEAAAPAATADPSRPLVIIAKPDHPPPARRRDKSEGSAEPEPMSLPAAPCCQPLPGERVVALEEPMIGYRIHAIDCPVLGEHENEMDRWLDVAWAPEASEEARNDVSIDVILANEPGALGEICSLIGASGANIEGIETLDRKPDFHRMRLDVEVRDLRHFSNVMTAISAQPIIAEAVRVRGAARGQGSRGEPMGARGGRPAENRSREAGGRRENNREEINRGQNEGGDAAPSNKAEVG